MNQSDKQRKSALSSIKQQPNVRGSILAPSSPSSSNGYAQQGRKSQIIGDSINPFGVSNGNKNDYNKGRYQNQNRPQTAAAPMQQMGKSQFVSRTSRGVVSAAYLNQQSLNQGEIGDIQIDSIKVDGYQNNGALRSKFRPLTAISKLTGSQSLITNEYQQIMEEKMHVLQGVKDKLSSALAGIQIDEKNKVIEDSPPEKIELKLEHGVQRLDMSQQIVELDKNGFKYFKISIKNKPQPVFICKYLKLIIFSILFFAKELNQIEKFKKNNLKIFLSTENQNPNIFNSNLIFENRYVIRFTEPSKTLFFSSPQLFMAFNTDVELRLVVRIKFGAVEEFKKTITETSAVNLRVKQVSKPMLSQMDDRTLQEEINEILQKRKMKVMDCSQGLEYLKVNKKMGRYKPEAKMRQESEKQYQSSVRFFSVLEQKKNLDIEKKQNLINRIDFQDKMRLLSKISKIENHLEQKTSEFQMSWMQIFALVSLVAKIKNIRHNEIVKRAQISYVKMRKRRVIRAFKVNQTKTGEDKFKRSLYKGRMCAQQFAQYIHKKTKTKASQIFSAFFTNYLDLSILSTKLLDLKDRVFKFENRWLGYKRRAQKYKEEVKRYWSIQNDILVPSVIQEQLELSLKESKQQGSANLENFIKQEVKKGQKQFQKIDGKLQEEIVLRFIEQRKAEWRDEFMLFRSQNFSISTLKRQLQFEKDRETQKKKNEFPAPSSSGEGLSEILSEPPKLFIKPNEIQLKEMVKIYLKEKRQTEAFAQKQGSSPQNLD